MSRHPSLAVGVLMRRERVPGPMARWQAWRWVLAGVVPAPAAESSTDADTNATHADSAPKPPPAPQCVASSEDHSLWLHTGLSVTLHRDDTEGYHLNLETEQPCIWVMWRADPVPSADDPAETFAVPQIVTLSYHDAGRWLDAQENVDQVDAPPEVLLWLRAFTEAHHQPEPKRRKRPDSFRSLTDRFGNPASVSTDKGGKGGGGEPRQAPDHAAPAPRSAQATPGAKLPRHGH